MRLSFLLAVLTCALAFASTCLASFSIESHVNVRLVSDEPEAVLAILAKKKSNEPITDADWQRVFQSEGYVRLKARETSLKNCSFSAGEAWRV